MANRARKRRIRGLNDCEGLCDTGPSNSAASCGHRESTHEDWRVKLTKSKTAYAILVVSTRNCAAAISGPSVHQAPSLGQGRRSPIGGLGLVANRVCESQLSDIPREACAVAGPIAESRAETMRSCLHASVACDTACQRDVGNGPER